MKIFKDKHRGYLNLDAIAIAGDDPNDKGVFVIQLVSGSMIRTSGPEAEELKKILEDLVINP